MSTPLLRVENLAIQFGPPDDPVKAVDGISFSMNAGETLAVVGESGSGKSVTALALTRLLASPPARYVSGKIEFEGRDVLQLPKNQMRGLRGKQIAYIFQEPGSSLNPVFTIGYQIREAIELHRPEVRDVTAEIVSALDRVGIREPAKRLDDYPHQLSGGMQQRVMIAMALACQPKLLVADEPTTALDVTIQKQIMDLLKELKRTSNMAILLITHNFGLVSDFADHVVVMFHGKIVETGATAEVLRNPQHAYTRALIECVPKLGQKQHRLKVNDMPELSNPPVRNQRHSMEFLIGQHSLFLAGLGQSFFYLHQFKPHLPVWGASSFLLIPWGLVFILFFHERPLFPPRSIRRWWLMASCGSALFTVMAEAIWLSGYMPPPTAEHRVAADVLVQVLMNLGWLSFIPMIRDHNRNPYLWL